jgi:hypothetical protein
MSEWIWRNSKFAARANSLFPTFYIPQLLEWFRQHRFWFNICEYLTFIGTKPKSKTEAKRLEQTTYIANATSRNPVAWIRDKNNERSGEPMLHEARFRNKFNQWNANALTYIWNDFALPLKSAKYFKKKTQQISLITSPRLKSANYASWRGFGHSRAMCPSCSCYKT